MSTRLEVRIQNPNAVFESWLERWISAAEHKGSQSQFKLREALNALKRYPLPLSSGKDCAILRGFGTKLCILIDNEMKLQKLDAHTITLNSTFYDRDLHQVVGSLQNSKIATAKEIPNKLSKKQLKVIAEEKERLKQVTMSPGTFKILLLVDTQETNGKNKRTLDHTQGYLETLSVEYEVRRLTVGDFVWIARDREGNELVLPYIVERKRMDDLVSSIRDGRFHEQKHRLKHSGLQHIIYLIEDYGGNEHLGLPLDNLYQALTNTLIHNNFAVEHTENHRRSMIYLQRLTIMLIRLYKNKVLLSCEKEDLKDIDPTQHMVGLLKFKSLYDDSARNAQLSIREIFAQQLLQLHSLTLEKTLAIVSAYATPRCLLDAYDKIESLNEKRNMLANISSGKLERSLGEKISEVIYNFYRTSSTEANKSPMGGLNSSSDDSNCSNQTTHSMVTTAASSAKIEPLPTNANNYTHNQNTNSQQIHNDSMKFITTPQMAETALQKLRQRFSNVTPLTSSSAESAMRSLELVRIAVQAQFDQEIDEMVKHFIETYFKPAFNNIKENLGQCAVNDDALQKMSCALLENAKSQYKILRHKPQQPTTYNVITNLSSNLESNAVRMALKRPSLIKPSSNVIEMQKRFFPDSQQIQHQQNQLQSLPPVGTIKATLAPNQHNVGLPANHHRQEPLLQQPSTNNVTVQSQQQNQNSHPRRQIFWNTANISTTTKFVLDVQANQAFGFGIEGKERLASKHPELIRYLPDAEDRDWLIKQQIIPHQNRNSRFLFLIYDEVCNLYHTHDVYKNKPTIDLSTMMTFTVPDFIIQKMKLFFVDLNIKSRGLITNSYSMSSAILQQPLQPSNSHLRNALLLGTSHSFPNSTITTSSVSAQSDGTPSSLDSSLPSSNITSTEALQQHKSKSSNLSSSHATLTALLNNSSSSSTNTSVNPTNLNEKSKIPSANSLPNLQPSSSASTITNKLRK